MTSNLTIPLTVYEKTNANGEPLCKRIGIGPDGLPLADASVCKMSSGEARHIELQGGLAGLVPLFTGMTSMQAISPGAIVPEHRPAPGETVLVTTKKRYEALTAAGKLNRGAKKTIARIKLLVTYKEGRPAALLIDFDTKGMPAAIRTRIEAAGGVWNLLVEAFPFLKDIERVERASTSAGLIGPDGQRFTGSGGVHFYLLILDGSDAVRALKNLRDRLWLAGLGWLVLSKSGAVLSPRSLLDAAVGGPEHLCFEGPPELLDGLTQDQEARKPVYTAGGMLDTRQALPELTAAEEHRLNELIAAARLIIKPAQEKVVREIVEKEAKEIVAKTGVPIEKARAKAKERVRLRLEEAILGPDHPLQFDDLGTVTVADVLADPDRFIDETLADPLEGIDYGAGKAKVFWGYDGRGPMINSFAHGGLKYRLVHDEEAIEQALAASDPKDTAAILARMLVQSHYGDKSPEEDRLITLAAKHTKGNKGPIKQAVKNARSAAAKTAAKAARAQRHAADPRPIIPAPDDKAEVGATLKVIESYLVTDALEPPMRGSSGRLVAVQEKEMPTTLHLLVSEHERAEKGDLPAPKQTVLAELDEYGIARMVEEHVGLEHVDPKSGFTSLVRLQSSFCQALNSYTASKLPVAWGVQALPLVLPDRKLLVAPGLHDELKLVMRVDPALAAALPTAAACTVAAAKQEYAFLTDDVLVDVNGTVEDKAILVSIMLTVIERHLLDVRPAFVITGSQAETGKTTAAQIVAMVTTGKMASATAWSPVEEERRKALFSVSLINPALVMYDNIPRGAQISCPHLEKSLTSPTIEDRILGISKSGVGMATTVHVLTGNRIAPKGDLATRSIVVNLTTSRADPANRNFKHQDIIPWVQENRLRILKALYTILMVERQAEAGQAQTRFKTWWELVGRPLEIVSGVKVGGLFRKTVENDEMVGAISALFSAWWGCFQGSEVTASEVHKILHDDMGRISGMLAKEPSPQARLYDAFFAATGGKLPEYRKLDTREVGSRLKSLDGYVADLDEEVTVRLHAEPDHRRGGTYALKILKGALPINAQKGI